MNWIQKRNKKRSWTAPFSDESQLPSNVWPYFHRSAACFTQSESCWIFQVLLNASAVCFMFRLNVVFSNHGFQPHERWVPRPFYNSQPKPCSSPIFHPSVLWRRFRHCTLEIGLASPIYNVMAAPSDIASVQWKTKFRDRCLTIESWGHDDRCPLQPVNVTIPASFSALTRTAV